MTPVVYKHYGRYDEQRMTVLEAVMDATSSRRTDEVSRLRAELDNTRELLASVIETMPAQKMAQALGGWYTVKEKEDDGA